MALPVLDDDGFQAQVIAGQGTILVDFMAEWCGPCRGVSTALENLQADYDGAVTFVKVDIDKAPNAAAQYGVTSIPQVFMFKGGQEVNRIIGGQPERKFRSFIDENK